uniref:Transcriptional regulator MraZ n=1 Tax=candidate division WOR-3 bacterium TaxID=2052148 RepID=A0A7C4U7C7_UNCW3
MEESVEEIFGHSRNTLDNKGRVFVPVEFRKALLPEDNMSYVLTRGPESCILMFPYSVWAELIKDLRNRSYKDKSVRDHLRALSITSKTVTLDPQGRIIIPKELLEYAGIEKDVLFIGFFDKIEIWNPSFFEKYSKENIPKSGFDILKL